MFNPILSRVTICNNTFCTVKYKKNDTKNWVVLKNNISTNIVFNDMTKNPSFVQRMKQRLRRCVLFLHINEKRISVPIRYMIIDELDEIIYRVVINSDYVIKISQRRCGDSNKYYAVKVKVKYHNEDIDAMEDTSIRSMSSNTDSSNKDDCFRGVKRRLSNKYYVINQEHNANCGSRSTRHSRSSNTSSNGMPRSPSMGLIDTTDHHPSLSIR